MRPELIGHYSHNRMHGGVISAALDAMGGLAVMAAIGSRVTSTRMEFWESMASCCLQRRRISFPGGSLR